MSSLLSNSIRKLSQSMEGEKVIDLALDLIDPDPTQPRKTFHDQSMQEMVASIAATRVHQPIIVTPRDSRYLIVFGERRWRGSGIAGKTTIPAIVRAMSDVDIKVARLIENMQREDVDPIEEAAAIKEVADLLGGGRGVQKKLADMLGFSEAKISQRLAMLNMPDEIKGAVVAGHIQDATTALDVARIHQIDPEAATALVDKAKTGELKRAEVREAVKSTKAKKAKDAKTPGEQVAPRCDKTADMFGGASNDTEAGSPGAVSVCQNLLNAQQGAVLSALLDELENHDDTFACLVEVMRTTLSRSSALGYDTNEILAAVNDDSKKTEVQGHGR